MDMALFPLRRLVRAFLVGLWLVLALGGCIGSRVEPFAPELGKEFVLTEELVQTSWEITLPNLWQPSKTVDMVMTFAEYQRTNEMSREYGELPNLGTVPKNSRVMPVQLFTYKDLNGSTRYGKLLISKLNREDQLTAYARWNYVKPVLQELK